MSNLKLEGEEGTRTGRTHPKVCVLSVRDGMPQGHNGHVRTLSKMSGPTPSLDDGQNLRALRKSFGISQVKLAKMAGVKRHTVVRWEGKSKFQRQSHSLKRILDTLAALHRHSTHRSRARVHGVLDSQQAFLDRTIAKKTAQQSAFEKRQEARRRVLCGAKTRKGTACRMKSEPGRRRCKYHGGKSTGPKTVEGRVRIAEAQRLRWAAFRQTR